MIIRTCTPEISELYRLAARKKDTEVSENSLMVQDVGKCLHEIEAEISRWRNILAVEYAQYLRGNLKLHPIVDLH